VTLASIPSPTTSVWHLGPLPLRAYALCIIAGVIAAIVISDRRLQARGGPKGAIMDVAVYAVPFGIIGARIYHVITSPQPYFGEGGHVLDALKIWEGGLGIWGAISGGALGAWIACRRLGLPLRVVADASAPGLAVAQAIGRFGNWFNNELYGRPTTLPWGLEIHVMDPKTGRAVVENGEPVLRDGLYQPTFLYESLWCLGVAALVIWADKRFQLGRGRAFALYVMAYTAGRVWIEALRIDEANHILGLRLNVWTSILVFAGALLYFLTHRGPREQLVVDETGQVRVIDPLASGATGAGGAAAGGAVPAQAGESTQAVSEPPVDAESAPAAEAAEPEPSTKSASTEPASTEPESSTEPASTESANTEAAPGAEAAKPEPSTEPASAEPAVAEAAEALPIDEPEPAPAPETAKAPEPPAIAEPAGTTAATGREPAEDVETAPAEDIETAPANAVIGESAPAAEEPAPDREPEPTATEPIASAEQGADDAEMDDATAEKASGKPSS